jgi:hypothetical protein
MDWPRLAIARKLPPDPETDESTERSSCVVPRSVR